MDQVRAQGARLVARVVSRDDLQLAPATLRAAAARRVRQGLQALEAFLRRVLVLLALQLEPGLTPDNRPRHRRMVRPRPRRAGRFRVFIGEAAWPGFSEALSHRRRARSQPVQAAPLLQRLADLQALLAAPQARARRLAWTLARRRPGWLLAPGRDDAMPRRFGTEISMLYDSLAVAILKASQARPPPLGRVPDFPPRIRTL